MKIATFCLLSLLKAYEVDHEQIPKYGYGSENGPSKWHELDPSYYLCKDGKMQSPIEINMNTLGTIVDLSYQELYFKWDKLQNAHLIKDGGTLNLEIPVSSTDGLTYNGTDYFMRNIHAHVNSEHVIFGHQ
jgi:carbonic anhydrase